MRMCRAAGRRLAGHAKMADKNEGGTWREVDSLETICGVQSFLSGIEVWINRPQVINRRLIGAMVLEKATTRPSSCEERIVVVRELFPRMRSTSSWKEIVTICE